jgi:hypothetical protein
MIENTQASLKSLTAKLVAGGSELRFCYQAGPCGYGFHRQLKATDGDRPRLHRCRPVVDPAQAR